MAWGSSWGHGFQRRGWELREDGAAAAAKNSGCWVLKWKWCCWRTRDCCLVMTHLARESDQGSLIFSPITTDHGLRMARSLGDSLLYSRSWRVLGPSDIATVRRLLDERRDHSIVCGLFCCDWWWWRLGRLRFILKSITCLFLVLKLSTWFLFTLKLSTWFFFFFLILVTLKLSTLTHGNELRNN